MLVTGRPFVVSTMGSVAAQHYIFVVSNMGSVTAQHYSVSFYACYRSSFCGVHRGFCNRRAL